MSILGLLLLSALVCVALLQVLLLVPFLRRLREGECPLDTVAAPLPRAAVILCLRGTDPFLSACLEGLLAQDYPDYEVHIVVDSAQDPAWPTVRETVNRFPAVRTSVSELRDRLDTCSLKCSSLVQAISGLDESCEVVALADADTAPHATWLRELVAPLGIEGVEATTGNRWYIPRHGGWGTVARYLWNAAAIVQMFWHRIPWGGSLAISMRAVRELNLLDRWRRAFCEDTMLFSALCERGWRVAFVPGAMMPNQEACRLDDLFGWVCRQLLTARLYHPRWPAVVAHAAAVCIIAFVFPVLAVLLLCAGRVAAAVSVLAGLALLYATLLVLLAVTDRAVRAVVRRTGRTLSCLPGRTLVQIPLALPLTAGLYAAAMARTLLLRTVEWRGVRYIAAGPFNIKLTVYQPFANDVTPDDKHRSL